MFSPASLKTKNKDAREEIRPVSNQLAKPSFPRISAYIALFVFLYIIFPVFLQLRYAHLTFIPLILFYGTIFFILFYLFHKNSGRKRRLELEMLDLREQINILNDQNARELKYNRSLQEKIRRYSSLKEIIEDISQNLELESITEQLVSIAFSLISVNKGTCILYLIDNESQKPVLFKTKKEDKDLIVKAKEGDIFDHWVLRHGAPLIIEDMRKDFRFDPERLKDEDDRPILSLASSPLISDHKFLGLLRLDNPEAGFYTQDDLRFLLTICDLGAIALETGELFQRTQDLAIHDSLTSLYTRGYFLERLKEEYRRSIRQNRPLSLLMLDIDFFKNYNDKYGHTAGDIVLRVLSRNIVSASKDLTPIIGRFGGEEFCIILSGMEKKKAYAFARDLCAKIEKTRVTLRRKETNITVSIGVASIPGDARDEDELLLKADKAMYEAKQRGRNRVCCI